MCLEMGNLILLALQAENGKADRFPIENKVSRTSSASAVPCVWPNTDRRGLDTLSTLL